MASISKDHYVNNGFYKKSFAYFITGTLLILAALVFWLRIVQAEHIAYDPYADSVANSTTAVHDANNAVGAPNGTNASLAGIDVSLTLDMGSGEEGTRALRVYLGQINAQANVEIAFLDSNQSVIKSESRQLGVDLNPSVQNFAYDWTDFSKAYRYVRISSFLGAGVNVDSIEAVGYLGSTESQDTDGDSLADRLEQHSGTNPLVFDPPSSVTPTPPGSGSEASGQVNPPPAVGTDQDGDGIPDTNEVAAGLDPNNINDGAGDPDHDGLSNLTEYKIGSDPNKEDTDGDGLPDKWEYDHGLDVSKNDADEDPDGDFLTNRGEYKHGTDPQKADDLYKIFGEDCKEDKNQASLWDWLIFGLILLAALLTWLAALATGPMDPPTDQSSRFYRMRYRLHNLFYRN